jgi:hypothetical protein
MNQERMRLTGLAGISAGVLIVAGAYIGELVHEYFFFLLVPAMLLILVALMGIQSRQRERTGLLARIGFVLAMVGFGLSAALISVFGTMETIFGVDLEASQGLWVTISEIAFVVAFISMLSGILIYGIATARANVLPRIAAILFVLGLPLAFVIDIATGSFFDETLTPFGLLIGFPIFALGIGWLGYALWGETVPSREAEAEEAAAPVAGGGQMT